MRLVLSWASIRQELRPSELSSSSAHSKSFMRSKPRSSNSSVFDFFCGVAAMISDRGPETLQAHYDSSSVWSARMDTSSRIITIESAEPPSEMARAIEVQLPRVRSAYRSFGTNSSRSAVLSILSFPCCVSTCGTSSSKSAMLQIPSFSCCVYSRLSCGTSSSRSITRASPSSPPPSHTRT